MRGKLVVFEGVEGSGKTTQLAHLRAWLAAHPQFQQLQAQGKISHIVTTREPGGTELGQQVRQLLLQPTTAHIHDRAELLLYAADRAQHVEEQLLPELEAGALILCDRYTDSTIAYQGYGRGINLALIDQVNQLATGGLASDLTLWLDLDAAAGLARTQQRGAADRIEQAALAFHQRVQQGFQALAAAHPDRILRIDADRSPTEVAAQIQAALLHFLQTWYFSPSHL